MQKKLDKIVPPAAYVQALRNNRLLTFVVAVFLIVIAILAFSIFKLLPLKTTELQVIEYRHSTDTFVKVLKPNKSIKDFDIVQSFFLLQYVKNRETIDRITEAERYEQVYLYSSKNVWQNFKATHDNKTSLYYKKGAKREIKIVRNSKLSNSIHQIEYQTIDTIDGDKENKKSVSEWVVTLRYENYSQLVNYDERYMNPLGTKVMEYSYSKRGK